MKKCILCLFVLFPLLFVSGCIDKYVGQRPIDYPGTRWISENPDMYFEVYGYSATGILILNKEELEIEVTFDHGTTMFVRNLKMAEEENYDNFLFHGECKFDSDTLTLKIDREMDSVFHGSIGEIVFKRQDITTNTTT